MPRPSALPAMSLLLLAAATGQEPTTAPASAEATPIFGVTIAGPAAIRAAFLPTNVGSMLASEEGERIWRPLVAQVDQWFRGTLGAEGHAQARERLLAFDGRASLAWFAGVGGGEEAVAGVVLIEGGSQPTLEALAADLDGLLAKVAPGEDLKVGVGEREFAARRQGDDSYMRPARLGDRVVAAFASEVELAAALPMLLRYVEQRPAAAAGPFAMTIDLGQIVDRFGPRGSDAGAWRDQFGLASLGTLTIRIAPRGPRCELEFTLGFRGDERGVFGALLPAVAGMPKLLERLPPGVTPWKCGPCSLPTLYRVLVATIGAEQHGGGEAGVEQARAEVRKALGFDVDTELLAFVGDELLMLGDFWDEGDLKRVVSGGNPEMGFCLVVPVRDDQAFSAGLDKLLTADNSLPIREREQRDGLDVRTIKNAFLPAFQVASGNGLALVAFGDEGTRHLAAVAKGAGAGAAPKALWERTRKDQPPGCNGIAVADLRALCGGQLPILMEILGDSLPARTANLVPPEMLPELLMQLAPLLEKHSLGEVVSYSGFAERTFRWRLHW